MGSLSEDMKLLSGGLLIWLAVTATALEDPLIETADGPVLGGVRHDQYGADYYAFEGIPFAAPPVGKLRFGAPQPVEPWTEPIDVSGYSDIKCVQYGYMTDGKPSVNGQEDCLYLTVYVPANKTITEPMPVMFWIYGGSLTAGANHFKEYGPMKWMAEEVIIVEPLYRLGPFGFTYLGIPEAPGNQGFLDLVKALEWVNINIAAFGGDPDRVTIFGESSGSWCVSYLTLTPLANGLFHRAIMQSGGAFNPYWTWQTANDSLRLASGLTDAFECEKSALDDPYSGLQCLQNLDYKTLESSTTWGMEETFNIQIIFRPTGVIDGHFLPDHPVKLMERGEYNHVDLIVGLMKDEGLLQTFQLVLHPELYPAIMFQWPDVWGPMFMFGNPGHEFTDERDLQMVEDLTKYYLPNGQWDFNPDHFDNITNMISDAYIWYGGHTQAKLAAANGDNVYQYIFAFKGQYSYGEAWGINDTSKYGVCHADELYYFWLPYWDRVEWDFTDEELHQSKLLLNAWSNFAKFGSPTLPGEETIWEQVEPDNHQSMIIDKEWRMELSDLYVSRMENWDMYYNYPEGDTIPDIPPEQILRINKKEFPYKPLGLR